MSRNPRQPQEDAPDGNSAQPDLIRDGEHRGRRKVGKWIAVSAVAATGSLAAAAAILTGSPPVASRNDAPAPDEPSNSEVDVSRGEPVPLTTVRGRFGEDCEHLLTATEEIAGESCIRLTGRNVEGAVEVVTETVVYPRQDAAGTWMLPSYKGDLGVGPVTKYWTDVPELRTEEPVVRPVSGSVSPVEAEGHRRSFYFQCGDGVESVTLEDEVVVFEIGGVSTVATAELASPTALDLTAVCGDVGPSNSTNQSLRGGVNASFASLS